MANSPFDDFISRVIRAAVERTALENPEFSISVSDAILEIASGRRSAGDLPKPPIALPKWWNDLLESLLDLYIEAREYLQLAESARGISGTMDGSAESDAVFKSVRRSLVVNGHAVGDKARMCGRIAINRLGRHHPKRQALRKSLDSDLASLLENFETSRNVQLHGQDAGGSSRPPTSEITDKFGWSFGLAGGGIGYFESIFEGASTYSSHSNFLSDPRIPRGARHFMDEMGGVLSRLADELNLPKSPE